MTLGTPEVHCESYHPVGDRRTSSSASITYGMKEALAKSIGLFLHARAQILLDRQQVEKRYQQCQENHQPYTRE